MLSATTITSFASCQWQEVKKHINPNIHTILHAWLNICAIEIPIPPTKVLHFSDMCKQIRLKCRFYLYLNIFGMFFVLFYTKREQFIANLPQKCIFFAIYLVIPQKSSTFAEDYVWIYV